MRLKYLSLLMALYLLLCMGCQDNKAMVELEEFRSRAAIEDQNREVARLYIEALNEGKFEEFDEYLAADFAIYSPSGYPEPTSREKLKENYTAARQAFSKFTWNIEDMIAARDRVICRIIVGGTYNGAVPDLSAPGQEFEFSLITIMRMENGKVVEEWQEDDQLGFARQLGMELKPKEED